MKMRAKLIIALSATVVAAVITVPRIIEAKRTKGLVIGTASSPPTNVLVQNNRPGVIVGTSIRNDTSAPLREMKQMPMDFKPEREANENPSVPHFHKDSPD